MGRMLCLNCFNIKNNYEVCPYCGYAEGAPPKELFQLKPGTILQNRYIIGEAIGYGGFGITYKAYDTTLSIIVAIKELYPAKLVNRAVGEKKVGIFSGSKTDEYQNLLKRFIEEARNMALFSKEKDIVNVFSYFEENGTAYIIMEYIDSPLLKQYLQKQRLLPEKQACDYICAVLEALEKIHEKGIIHRDISPDNIFLVSNSKIKLFDFGAAKLQSTDDSMNLPVVVKAGYTPPEQYRSKYEPDVRSDIYAVGAVLYQMLTGERPVESLDRAKSDMLVMPSRKGIHVHRHVEKALRKSLALNPEERFSSAGAFREALGNGNKTIWKWW